MRSGEPVAGFTIGGEDLEGDGTLFASQDLDDRRSILWGLGTRSMPIAAGTIAAGVDHLEILRSASVDVFTGRGTVETASADVEVRIAIPICAGADYNGNGLVEQADLDLVLGNWGASADNRPPTWMFSPATGIVDQNERDDVLANWGGRSQAGLADAGSIPEPSSIALLLVVIGLGLGACRAWARWPWLGDSSTKLPTLIRDRRVRGRARPRNWRDLGVSAVSHSTACTWNKNLAILPSAIVYAWRTTTPGASCGW